MASTLKITQPRNGDVLTRHDGVETSDALTVTVRGSAPPGADVEVNGHPADTQGPGFACDVHLTGRTSVIEARAGDRAHRIVVQWLQGSRKRFRFSADDNIQFLKDLGLEPARYRSLFDHWYLGFWREMHEEFGTKVHLNIYYQTDGFDLTQMPGKWKEEWQANAAWLHVSFHALQDKPDRPYRNAAYAQMAHDYDLVCGHIRRFAGNEVIGGTTTVHWAECPKHAVIALRDRGIERLIALFDVQGYDGECTTGYYLPRQQCAHCDTRGAWYDPATDLTFIRCTAVVNALEVEEIAPFLDARTDTPHTADMLELLIHEQYFRQDPPVFYQPTVFEKVRTALQWATQRGYQPVFWSDGFLGTPSGNA